MNRASVPPTADQALWVVIRNSAEALSFENYAEFIEPIMGGGHPQRSQGHFAKISQAVQLAFPDAEPYRLLKVATEVFMMANCGVVIDENLQGTVDSTTLADADFSSLSSDPANSLRKSSFVCSVRPPRRQASNRSGSRLTFSRSQRRRLRLGLELCVYLLGLSKRSRICTTSLR